MGEVPPAGLLAAMEAKVGEETAEGTANWVVPEAAVDTKVRGEAAEGKAPWVVPEAGVGKPVAPALL